MSTTEVHVWTCFVLISMVTCNSDEAYQDLLQEARCKAVCLQKKQVPCEVKCIEVDASGRTSNEVTDLNALSLMDVPQTLCLKQNAKEKVTLYLHWMKRRNLEENLQGIHSPVLFVLELNTKNSSAWKFLAMGEENVAVIEDLEPSTEYKFRVTVVSPQGQVSGSPLYSDWIMTPQGFSSRPKGPGRLQIQSLGPDSKGLSVRVTWEPDPDLPCFYRLTWLSKSPQARFRQVDVLPGAGLLGYQVPGMSYSTDYEVLLTSASNWNFRPESRPTKISFRTPACLDVTAHNFTLCSPSAPANVTFERVGIQTALISWSPPSYTTPENAVTKYEVTVVNVVSLLEVYKHKPLRVELVTEPNITEVLVEGMEQNERYRVAVFAVSTAGRGQPAVLDVTIPDEIPDRVLSTEPDTRRVGLIFSISIPGGVILLVLVVTFICRCHRKMHPKHSDLRKPNRSKALNKYVMKRPRHSCPFQVDFCDLVVNEELGSGAFGVVRKGILTRGNEQQVVAVKTLKDESNQEQRRQLWQEIELLRMLGRHPHVVCLQAYACSPSSLAMVVEFCSLGNLHSHLKTLKNQCLNTSAESGYQSGNPSADSFNNFHDFEDEDTKRVWTQNSKRLLNYAWQVANGMEYVSSCKLVHRDLAARNVLLESTERIKITDFGLGRDVYEAVNYNGFPSNCVPTCLPYRWMPPEAIAYQEYSMASDMWSFGVLLWELLTLGKIPYSEIPNHDILDFLKIGKRLKQPSACSPQLYDVMSKCWCWDPKRRPNFSQIKKLLENFQDVYYTQLLE